MIEGNAPASQDTRYVYSSLCTWHGPIQETKPHGGPVTINGGPPVDVVLPGCPHCGAPLLEYPDRATWDSQAEKFATETNLPMYIEWVETLRNGHCRPLQGWDWRADYDAFARKRTV